MFKKGFKFIKIYLLSSLKVGIPYLIKLRSGLEIDVYYGRVLTCCLTSQ
jgi:hypothetical protein